MPDRVPAQPLATSPGEDPEEQTARWELLDHLQQLLEPMMIALGFAFLILLVVDFATLAPERQTWLDRGLTAIWAVFVGEFLLRLLIAPSKPAFLRANWLSAASLVLPFLRPIRALQAVRAVRSLRLVRLLGGANRGMRVLQRVAGGRQLAYIGALTIMVTLLSAVGVLFFDRHAEGATIRTFGDALWWSTAMITTINNEKYVVSPEARVIAILQRVFAVSVFGFVTASIASYLVGRQVEGRTPTGEDEPGRGEHQAALHAELTALRREVAALRVVVERDGQSANSANRPEQAHGQAPVSSPALSAAPRPGHATAPPGGASEEPSSDTL